MLYYAVVFLIIALVAGFFGFGGVASTAASIAQVLFFVFLVVFLVPLNMSLFRGVARGLLVLARLVRDGLAGGLGVLAGAFDGVARLNQAGQRQQGGGDQDAL